MYKQELFFKLEKLLIIDKCKDINYERNKTNKNERNKVIESQKGLCFLCKCKTTIPLVHHVIPDGDNNEENLIMLCPLCHKWVHWMLKRYLGYRATIEPWRKYG